MRPWRILHALCLYPLLLAPASAQVRLQPILEVAGETSSPSLSPDGKTLAFEWSTSGNPDGIYTRPLEGGEPKLLVEGSLLDPKWSPDGRKLAFMRGYSCLSSLLFVRSVADGKELNLGRVCIGSAAVWSPDGRFLVAGVHRSEANSGDCPLTLISAETGQRVRELAPDAKSAAFSPDGGILAYPDRRALKLLSLTADYQPRGPARILVTEPRPIAAVCWSRDGKQLIYNVRGDSPYLRKIGLEAGAQPQSIAGVPSELDLSEMLPDGSALATETVRETALWRVDLRSPNPRAEKVRDLPWTDELLRFSPDGLRLAFITTRTGFSQIWLANPDGTNQRPLVESVHGSAEPEDQRHPTDLEWSPDGKWIAFTADPLFGFNFPGAWLYVVSSSGGPVRCLLKGAVSIEGPSWAADGKSIFASRSTETRDKSSRPELVRIDLADGAATQITQRGGNGPHPSADGKFLYYYSVQQLPQLSRVPVSGGVEERLTVGGVYDWPVAGVGSGCLYLFQALRLNPNPWARRLVRFDPATRRALPLAPISVPIRTGSAHLTGDGRYLYFEEAGENPRQRVVLVRGL